MVTACSISAEELLRLSLNLYACFFFNAYPSWRG